jgi:hypothetical protein
MRTASTNAGLTRCITVVKTKAR